MDTEMDRQKAQAEKDRTAAEMWRQMEIQQRCELLSNNRAKADETKSRAKANESNTLVAMDRAMIQGITVDTGFTTLPKQSTLASDQDNASSNPCGHRKYERPPSTIATVQHEKNAKTFAHPTGHDQRNTYSHAEEEVSNSGATSAEVPSESNSLGVESDDGVVVARPPAFPARLLDWDDEDQKKREEAVAQRQRRLTRDRTLCAGVVAKRAITRHVDAALHGLGLRKDEKTDSENGYRPHGSGDKQDGDGQDWVKL